jgi:hypothetical protein
MNQTEATTIRILVTAATRHGATAEIAGVIAEHLTAAGHDVDLREPGSVHELASRRPGCSRPVLSEIRPSRPRIPSTSLLW